MKKTKKQLLGLAGLAAVGIMTAIAYGLPAEDAAAAPINDTTINVQVSEGTPSNIFTSPSDGTETVDSIIKVSTNYSQAKRLDYYLSYKDENGNTQRVDLPSYTPTDTAGTHSFDLDISRYGFGEFELHTSVTGYDNVTRETDTVTFTYNAAVVEPDQGVDGDNNPIIGIEVSDSTERIVVTVFDKDGNPAFVDANGNIVNIELDRSDIDPATGKILVTLPFEEYGSKPGIYTAVISSYDQNNKLLSMVTVQVEYSPRSPETPETPNTGMLSTSDFNISNMDYIITGLIAFGAVSAFAFFLIYRKTRR